MNKPVELTTTRTRTMEATVFEHGGERIHFLLPSATDHISKTIITGKGFYEAELLQALRSELAPDDLVIDVGANLGNHTVYFARIAGCRVAAFEAHPEALNFLQENVKLNGLADRVDVFPFAVSDQEGRVAIVSEVENNLGATRFGMDPDGTVRAVRLDDQEFDSPVKLMKVDVEGMETHVLRGAAALIARDRPLIVCEAQTHDEFQQISLILEQHFYVAAGCFNATDTFLFMPAKSEQEQSRLARHEATEVVRTQTQLRAAASQLRVLQKVVDRQVREFGQLSARISGDPASEGSKGLVGEIKGLAGKVDKSGARLEQAQSSFVDALATFARQTEQLTALTTRAQATEDWMSTTRSIIHQSAEMLSAFEAKFQSNDGKFQSYDAKLDDNLARFGEQAAKLETHDARLDAQEAKLEAHDAGFGTHEARLEAHGELFGVQESKLDAHYARFGAHEARIEVHEARIEAHDAVFGVQESRLDESHLELLRLSTSVVEANARIDHVQAQRGRNEVEINRLDRRMSEQVRSSKATSSELRGQLAAKVEMLERLEADLARQRDRVDALFAGRIFTWLRRAKSALRFVLWPVLKLSGRIPSSHASEAGQLQLQPQPKPAHMNVSDAAKTAIPGPAPAPTQVTAAAAIALVDVPYMRRPLDSLRKEFLNHPVAENALVSVVMTTFNTESLVRAAAESILGQTHLNLELIVVDDCSTDHTREIVQELAARDPRVKLVSFGENRGTYWCKNFGITQACGAAVTFMDSDDVSEPTRVAKQLALLREPGMAVTTCLHERRDEGGNIVTVNGRTKRIAYISQMMRRDVFDVIGYFDTVRTSADDEMLRRIKRTFGESSHRCVPEVLYKALVHGASLTQDPQNRGIASAPGGLSGPRKAYSDAVDAWHADLASRGAYPFVPFPVVRRPFAVDAKLSVTRGGVANDHIAVCLASFPPRRSALRSVVESLIDQVDRMYVYLNQYEEIPSFLKHPRITLKVGGEDLRDNGKFFFLPEIPEGYCFTVDDDIVYPPDYVQSLVRKIELYGRKAVVGLHGTIFAKPLVSYFADRTLLHFKHPLGRDLIVNQLGTGTVAFHTSLWRPSHREFASTGMVDAWLAVGAAKRGISMIAVDRKRNWLKPIELGTATLFDEYRSSDGPQTALVKAIAWTETASSALASVVAARIAAGGDAYAACIFEGDASQATLEVARAAQANESSGATVGSHTHRAGTSVHPRVRGTLRLPSDADRARLDDFIGAMLQELDELYLLAAPAQSVPAQHSANSRVFILETEYTDDRAHFDAITGFRGCVVPLDLAIDYPPHHARRLVDAVDRYGRKAVVGWLSADSAGDAGESDRQVRTLVLPLSAFHTDTLKISIGDIAADETVADGFARLGRVQGAPFVELAHADREGLRSQNALASENVAPSQADVTAWLPLLHAPYRRPTFRMAIVGRTDRARWKKGGILKSTHLTADMLRPFGVNVALVDLETGDPHTLDGNEADLVMIYPGDPERPDFVKVLQLVDEHARAGRAVLVNLSLNNRSSRKHFICQQMQSWRAQYGKRVAVMVFSDRVFDDPELETVRDTIVAIPKTLQMVHPREADFHSTSGIFLGDYGKLCDESLLAWPAEDAIAALRDAVPHAHLFAVQQYKPKVKKDLGIEVAPFLTDDYTDVLSSARLMVSLVKYATFEMVPLEVAGLGVPLLHAKMENSISDYMGMGAVEITSLERLGSSAKLVYDDPLCWSALSRAGHAITHGLDYRNMSAQMYLRLLQFLKDAGL